MKATFALLAATTALGAVLILSSIGAGLASNSDAPSGTEPAQGATAPDGMPVLLADNGSDDDDNRRARRGDDDSQARRGEDDRQARRGDDDRQARRGDDDHDDCEADDDEGRDCVTGLNAAPAGTVAPPANGLFGTGPAPQVQVN